MSEDFVVIGEGTKTVQTIGVIRDQFGEVTTDYEYAFNHPDIYQYLGSDLEWNVKVHYFRFIE